MIVASSGNVGKGEILVRLANRLTDRIGQAVRQGTSLYDFERSVLHRKFWALAMRLRQSVPGEPGGGRSGCHRDHLPGNVVASQ